MRIAVKNVPASMTREEIEKEFSQHGKITDVFMARDGQGAFRRVCFVGYLEEKDGLEAIRYRNGSLLKNQRIRCEEAAEESREASESEERMVRYSRKIFVRDVPEDADEGFVRRVFGEYGEIEEAGLVTRKAGTGAYVKFRKGECAVDAFRRTKFIGGIKARMLPWKDKENKQRHEHYNTLFFSFESIVKRICERERLGVRDVVDVGDKDLGARMARIEAHLVQETKEFLESNGIHLDRLTGGVDKKTLIVRNMELMRCLDLVGNGCKISIAPSKCLALLRFDNEEEAKRCHRKLCLRRVKEDVVYCEYAPVSGARETCVGGAAATPSVRKGKEGLNKLLVRNVPFQASPEEIKKIFGMFDVVGVRLPVKREGSSRGFCFVTFNSPDDVTAAIEHFGSSTHLYGRRLVLERAKS